MGRSYIVAGNGFGDEGKGKTVDYLCWATGTHTVVRFGGPQALHGAAASDGRRVNFRHFGSGTLRGAQTHFSRYMLMEPESLFRQVKGLAEVGISDAYQLLTIDEEVLLITPWHAAVSQLKELARGAKKHGTVGLGVGETMVDASRFPDSAIRAKDMGSSDLRERLAAIRERKRREAAPLVERAQNTDQVRTKKAQEALDDEQLLDNMADIYRLTGQFARVVDGSYLGGVLRQPGTVVFESSQGALLDQWIGFHPYTTRSMIAPELAFELLKEQSYSDETALIGVSRAYQTRHGAGPFVTEDAALTERLPDAYNGQHPWQGAWRVGWWDAVANRYAVAATPETFAGLSLSCLDRLGDLPTWQICDAYTYAGEATSGELDQYFEMNGDNVAAIRVRPNTRDDAQLAHQERLGELLAECRPVLTTIERKPEAFIRAVEERLNLPIAITSYGPTERETEHRVGMF